MFLKLLQTDPITSSRLSQEWTILRTVKDSSDIQGELRLMGYEKITFFQPTPEQFYQEVQTLSIMDRLTDSQWLLWCTNIHTFSTYPRPILSRGPDSLKNGSSDGQSTARQNVLGFMRCTNIHAFLKLLQTDPDKRSRLSR